MTNLVCWSDPAICSLINLDLKGQKYDKYRFKYMYVIYKLQIDASETLCHVCSNEVGVAHRCRNCNQFVHLICGRPLDEEGYGQNIICYSCKGKGK